jgi:hypothetical protein
VTFTDRITQARAHEKAVEAHIDHAGWDVCEFGQGCLSEEVRRALQPIDTPLRWMPDLVAVRGQVAYLVDGKWSNRQDTGNYDIECSSLAALHEFYISLRLPVVTVWFDFRCNFSWELLASDAPLRRGPWRGNGSGTPFWLWPQSASRPFAEIFGPDAPPYGPPPEWRMRELRGAS